MQDPEFEKTVRQKMEELNFSPPEGLWGKVELEIKSNPRSKRILFWFLPIFLLLLAAGTYTLLRVNNRKINQLIASGSSAKRFSAKSSSVRELPRAIQSEKRQVASKKNPVDIKTYSSAEKNAQLGQEILLKPGIQPITSHSKMIKRADNKERSSIKTVNSFKDNSGSKGASLNATAYRNIPSSSISAANGQVKNQVNPRVDADALQPSIVEDQVNSAPSSVQKNNAIQSKKEPLLLRVSPETSSISKNESNGPVSQRHSDSTMNTAAETKKPLSGGKKHSWAIGITVSPGSSEMEKGIFKSGSTTDVPTYFSASSNGSTGLAAGGYPNTPSEIRPDFSFIAGTFIQKTLGGRLSLVVGLNYHYYSTRIKTGYKIDSLPAGYNYTPTTSNIPGLIPLSINSYYLIGSNKTYTNHFHLIEIPISLQLNLNRNSHLPVAWEAGLTISRLLGSDALHFDQTSGIYYSDNALFNKTQLGASSSILIGFYEQAHLIQIGPTIQYGISNLLQSNSGDSQHLVYYGIKLTMLSGKTIF